VILEGKPPGYWVVFNSESLFTYFNNPSYMSAVDGAEGLYCDGVGVMVVASLKGKKITRKYGPDIFEEVLKKMKGRNILFIGGNQDNIDGLERLFAGFFRDNKVHWRTDIINVDDEVQVGEMATFIKDNNIDTVLVTIGIVRQELLVAKLVKAQPQIQAIGIGAAIDFLSEVKTRSHPFFQKIGLEWLPRLIREPRMAIRVLLSIRGIILGLKRM